MNGFRKLEEYVRIEASRDHAIGVQIRTFGEQTYSLSMLMKPRRRWHGIWNLQEFQMQP